MSPPLDRTPVALVLGAGGIAGGAFHAGVLAALAETFGWDPRRADVIVGTSAGSVTGATLRAGLPAADLLARAEGRPLSAVGARLLAGVGPPRQPPPRPSERPRFRPPADIAATLARAAARPFSVRPSALLAGLLPEGTIGTEFITESIAMLHPEGWSAEPLLLCAVRQRDGRLVVFGRDLRPPVADAVAASCAIPGFFRPVVIDGEGYVDGGAHSPTNADVLTRDVPTVPSGRRPLVIVSSPMSHAGSVRRAGIPPLRRWARGLLEAEAFRLRRRGAHVIAFQPTETDLAVMGANAMDPRLRADIARQARTSTLQRLARHDVRERLAALIDDRQ
jgi:NTE family protein